MTRDPQIMTSWSDRLLVDVGRSVPWEMVVVVWTYHGHTELAEIDIVLPSIREKVM